MIIAQAIVTFLCAIAFPVLTLLVMDLRSKAERTKVLPGVTVGHLEKALELGFTQAPRSLCYDICSKPNT